jgi:hypothetical protein
MVFLRGDIVGYLNTEPVDSVFLTIKTKTMTTFNPENPFNIRGVKISPRDPDSSPDQPTPKNKVNYYFYFIDVVSQTGVDASLFTLSNLTETGSTLNYTYSGSLQLPTQEDYDSGNTFCIGLPLYTNQQIDQPNDSLNNLTAVLTVEGNGASYKGNPQLRRPPVFDNVYSAAALTCFPFVINSATDSGCNCLIILANTGTAPALNFGSITADADGEKYALTFAFAKVGTDGKPGVGHSVVCIGQIGYPDLSVYGSVVAKDTDGVLGTPLDLDFTNGSIPVLTPPL